MPLQLVGQAAASSNPRSGERVAGKKWAAHAGSSVAATTAATVQMKPAAKWGVLRPRVRREAAPSSRQQAPRLTDLVPVKLHCALWRVGRAAFSFRFSCIWTAALH